MSSRGHCGLCKKTVLTTKPRVKNTQGVYTHESCYNDAHQLCCESCEKTWLWPTKETNNSFHPIEWCVAVYDDGRTNESVYCPTCASKYGGVPAVNSNSELFMVP